MQNSNIELVLWIVILLALVVIGPLLTIWALNTLFATGIEYNIKNWAAMVVLGMFLQARVTKS
jgi:hypothetical protein